MHKHHYGRRHHGFAFGRGRFPNAEKLLEWLEEHQRDLEQEVADIADLIRRLKTETPQATSV